jgi:hypothetical protein
VPQLSERIDSHWFREPVDKLTILGILIYQIIVESCIDALAPIVWMNQAVATQVTKIRRATETYQEGDVPQEANYLA